MGRDALPKGDIPSYACAIHLDELCGYGLSAKKLWERCEVPTPPSSLNAYMFGRGHVARDVNRAMMLELFVKEVGAEAAYALSLLLVDLIAIRKLKIRMRPTPEQRVVLREWFAAAR